MSDSEKSMFDTGQLVVRNENQAGKNLCIAYHPEELMHRWLTKNGFTLVDIIPGGAEAYLHQDAYLVEKRVSQ